MFRRRDFLASVASLIGIERAQAFGFGQLGASEGRLGNLGTVNIPLSVLPAGYGYRYWVDGNGNNQLILYQDASGNYYALYAPLP